MSKSIRLIPAARVWVYWIIAGAFLLVAGIVVYSVPDAKLSGTAKIPGMAMLLAGVVNLMVYYKNKNGIQGAHWLFADGLTATFLSFFPLFSGVISAGILPFFFGFWELFSGIIKFVESSELHDENFKFWYMLTALGGFELVSGMSSIMKPVDDFIGMNHVIAMIFFVQSFGFVFKIIMYHYLVIGYKSPKLNRR